MCGRYTEFASPDELADVFELPSAPQIPPRYNIAPTQPAPVVLRTPKGERQLVLLQWGLVPHWAEDTSMAARMINARSETVASKPAFRDPFKYRRCVVPCCGFYEWKQIGDLKVPHFIHRPAKRLFALAGLWDTWQSPDGTEVHTYTVLTTTPNREVADLHDRMPVVLPGPAVDIWLDPELHRWEELGHLLRPARDGSFDIYPVARSVNRVAVDDPSCIEPSDPPSEQLSLF